MKTKWLAGIVGIALVLGMMVSCSTGSGDGVKPSPVSLTIKTTSAANASAVIVKENDTTISGGVGTFSTGGIIYQVPRGVYTLSFTVSGDDAKKNYTVTVGKSKTVTIQKENGVFTYDDKEDSN
ncbi:hypothetical protein AGMMS50268_05190 [Spirochaetia bacterium]|nr:hypothetical protein AGMMS50268_05190 [Spirochaetia bacterium]